MEGNTRQTNKAKYTCSMSPVPKVNARRIGESIVYFSKVSFRRPPTSTVELSTLIIIPCLVACECRKLQPSVKNRRRKKTEMSRVRVIMLVLVSR